MNKKINERVLDILEWHIIQEKLESLCATDPGKNFCDSIAPMETGSIKKQLTKITELKELFNKNISLNFAGIHDISPLLILVEKEGTLKIEELVMIKKFITASQRIYDFLTENNEELQSLQEEKNDMDRLRDIGSIIIPSITDNNELSETRYPQLKKLKREIQATRDQIEKRIHKLLYSSSIESALQEKVINTRGDRYVILVKANMKTKVKGTVHDISSSGNTLYVEPDEVTSLNNTLITTQKELQYEILRILKSLSQSVADHSPALHKNLRIIAYLDFLRASAKMSIAITGNAPEVTDRPELILYQAKHPGLYLLEGTSVVANDITLGNDFTCMIISGANTGGKTVLLKTIGLCALMVMHGLHIPAGPDSVVGVFTSIFADIGDDQNLSQSLSTFSGQLTIINEMISQADAKTLVLIDEIMVGTNPRQGASLAQAILEQLIETGCRSVITTHYSELKELASSDDRFINASVSFDLETLKPTYKLRIGLPGVSYAIEIAKNYHMRQDILDRARQLLDAKEITVEALLEEMQQYKEQLEEERSSLRQQKSELEREKQLYKKKHNELYKREQDIKHSKGLDFLEELNSYKEQLAAKIKELQNAGLKETGQLQDEIISLQKQIAEQVKDEREKKFESNYLPFDPSKIKKGDSVFIIPLEQKGKIEEIDIKKETALILFGSSFRTRFAFKDLLVASYQGNSNEKSNNHTPARDKTVTITRNEDKIQGVIQTSYNTIDLRGKRVDEAIQQMESGLDQMSRNSITPVIIIHGHGTGALKEAVRQNLTQSYYARGYRPGEQGEGGDGVTVVELR